MLRVDDSTPTLKISTKAMRSAAMSHIEATTTMVKVVVEVVDDSGTSGTSFSYYVSSGTDSVLMPA